MSIEQAMLQLVNDLRNALRDDMRTVLREELGSRALEAPDKQGWTQLKRAAEYADLKPVTLRRWIKRGKLPFIKEGNKYRIRLADIDLLRERTDQRSEDDTVVDIRKAALDLFAKSQAKRKPKNEE